MIIKDLGAVSAYAYAVEKGYTGTEEEFATLMASYATVAEEAAESAESASTSAESASASAQTATTKASEASTSATQASASATSASQSASTATTKASEASASASTAGTKASEASISATTASSKASEASASATSAQTAQGLAESARDDAIGAKTDAESARDLAQQYAESIDPEKIYSAYPTDTASGRVVSFADGADDIPLKSCVVAIEPVQSGSGDPSPDNVRPISGWTGAQVVRSGKNLFSYDPAKATTGTTTAETIRAYYPLEVSNCTLSFSAELIDSGSVTLPNINIGKLKDGILSVLDSFISPSEITERTFTFSENEQAVLMASNSSVASITDNFPKYRICVTTGSTATDYEPYTGNTYSITFPTEAGTVYGGELDVTNGVLTVDRAMVDLGTLNWRYTATYDGRFYTDLPVDAKLLIGVTGSLCSRYAPTEASDWQRLLNYEYILRVGLSAAGRCAIAIRDDDYTDAAAFKTAMNGVQLCYELATPITYTLTPTEIKSLLGDNNIWADAGDTAVTYRADTAKYIDKKIAEVINAL